MPRPFRLSLALVAAALVTGCGSQGIQLSQDDPYYGAAVIFQQRCAGCHTLQVAGGEGSAVKANSRERKDGPNFNVRAEDYESVIYAIRNGGFSSGPMPQNIVVGRDAELVACFVAKYSGRRFEEFSGQGGAEEAERGSPDIGAPASGKSGQTGLPDIDEDCPS